MPMRMANIAMAALAAFWMQPAAAAVLINEPDPKPIDRFVPFLHVMQFRSDGGIGQISLVMEAVSCCERGYVQGPGFTNTLFTSQGTVFVDETFVIKRGFNTIYLQISPKSAWRVRDLLVTGPAPSMVPEPATWTLFLLAFGALGVGLRSSRKRFGCTETGGTTCG